MADSAAAEEISMNPHAVADAAAFHVAANTGGGGQHKEAMSAAAITLQQQIADAILTCGDAWEEDIGRAAIRREEGKGGQYPQISRIQDLKILDQVNPVKFRFFIFAAGPPGSGKSTIALKLQKIATSINASAAGFADEPGFRRERLEEATSEVYKTHGWVVLGHDQEICENNDKREELCQKLQAQMKPLPQKPEKFEDWAREKIQSDQNAYNLIRRGPSLHNSYTAFWRRKCANQWFTYGTPCHWTTEGSPAEAAAGITEHDHTTAASVTTKKVRLFSPPPQQQWKHDIEILMKNENWIQTKKEEATAVWEAGDLKPWVLSSLAAIDYWGTDERLGGLPFVRPPKYHSADDYVAIQKKGDLCRKTEGEVDAWGQQTLAATAESVDVPKETQPAAAEAVASGAVMGAQIESPRCTVRNYFKQQGLSGTDMLLYTKIPYMINNGVNIVYETTFQNMDTIRFICEQIVQQTNNCETFQYIIMLGFPIVNIGKLQRRIWCREKDSLCHTCPQQCPDDIQKSDDCYRGLQGIRFKSLAGSMKESYNNLISIIEDCARRKEDGAAGGWGCKGVNIDLLYIYDNNEEGRLVSAIRLSRRSYKIKSGNKRTAYPIGPNNLSDVLRNIRSCLECISEVRDVHGESIKHLCDDPDPEERDPEDPCTKNPLANFNTLSGPINAEAEEEEEEEGRESSPGPNELEASQKSYSEELEEPKAKESADRGNNGGGRGTRKYRKKSKRRTRRR